MLNQLRWEGQPIEPGQKIRYVTSDYDRKLSHRVEPIEFAKKYGAKNILNSLKNVANRFLNLLKTRILTFAVFFLPRLTLLTPTLLSKHLQLMVQNLQNDYLSLLSQDLLYPQSF